jgi:hypothetical protein
MKFNIFFVLVSLIILSSCSSDSKVELPNSVGKLGSLVLVTDAETQKALNEDIENVFLQPIPYLPAGEPVFELVKTDPYDFQRFFFNQQTVMVLVNENNLDAMEELLQPFTPATVQKLMNDTNVVLMSKKNLNAKYQHVLYLFAKNQQDLRNKLLKAQNQILETLMDFEIKDQHDKMYKDSTKLSHYEKMMKDSLGLTIKIPNYFSMKRILNNVYWFQMDATEGETPKNIGLIVHSYPYRDTSDFTYASIISERDSVCKYLIAGELPGTYMGTTESKYYPPRFRNILEHKGRYCAKIRGWWTIKGLSQAGPFIRYVIHLPERNRLFVFEGFLYKPNLNTKERDLRLIEAIAQSIQ